MLNRRLSRRKTQRVFIEVRGKNMLDDCWEIMSSDIGRWLELKRVMCQPLRAQRAVKLEALFVARMQCQTEYIATIKTGNECQL